MGELDLKKPKKEFPTQNSSLNFITPFPLFKKWNF